MKKVHENTSMNSGVEDMKNQPLQLWFGTLFCVKKDLNPWENFLPFSNVFCFFPLIPTLFATRKKGIHWEMLYHSQT